jgi:hypothetical protein
MSTKISFIASRTRNSIFQKRGFSEQNIGFYNTGPLSSITLLSNFQIMSMQGKLMLDRGKKENGISIGDANKLGPLFDC